MKQPGLHRAVNEQFDTMKLAIFQLQTLGYHRIGLVLLVEQDDRVDNRWTAAFGSYLHYASPADRVPMFVDVTRTKEGFYKWFHKYKPAAILGIGIEEVGSWLAEIGCHSPANVGLAELNLNPRISKYAGVDENVESVGAAAVDTVVEQLNSNTKGIPKAPKVVMIKGTWVHGASVVQQSIDGLKHSYYGQPSPAPLKL